MTSTQMKKVNAVFDVLEAQGVEFPNVPTRIEVNPNGTVRIDLNLDNLSDATTDTFIAMIPADFAYNEQGYAHRALGNAMGINVIFCFYIATAAYEEAR